MEDSDSSGGLILALIAAGPGAGIVLWGWIQAKYRNKAARYMPERVVHHQVHNLQAEDTFVKNIVSTSASIDGRNESNHTLRARQSKAIKS